MEKHECMSDELRKNAADLAFDSNMCGPSTTVRCAQYQCPKTFEEMLLNMSTPHCLTEIKQ
jgi:hypothetical protein